MAQLQIIPLRAELGPLACLVNNASLFEFDDPARFDPATWDRHAATNVRAPLILSREFAQQLPADLTVIPTRQCEDIKAEIKFFNECLEQVRIDISELKMKVPAKLQ